MNKISRLRQQISEHGTATINVDDFNHLQSEWITRVTPSWMKKEIAEIKLSQRWMPVDEDPPSAIGECKYSETDYLVVIDGVVEVAFWEEGITVKYWSGWSKSSVSHWMPFPLPPTEGTDDA